LAQNGFPVPALYEEEQAGVKTEGAALL